MKSITLDDLIETLGDYLDDSDMSEIPTEVTNHLWDKVPELSVRLYRETIYELVSHLQTARRVLRLSLCIS